jgi:hypothetical protein
MEYKFEEFNGKGRAGSRSGGEYLTIRNGYHYLSARFRNRMGMDAYEHTRIDLYTDRGAGAIAVKIHPSDYKGESTTSCRYGYFGSKIGESMPSGRYDYLETVGEKHIFKIKTQRCETQA